MEYESEEDQKRERWKQLSNNFDATKSGDVIRRVFCTQEENKKIRRDDDHGGCRGSNETYLREKASRNLCPPERDFVRKNTFSLYFFVTFLISGSEKKKSFWNPKIFPLKASRSRMK